MTGPERLNLALRGVLELGVVTGLAAWGWDAGGAALAVVAPVLGFGLWGAVDFRGAGRAAEPLRLAEELIISAAAALAVGVAGHPALGWSLVGVSGVHHALVYATGHRLLE